jgi:methylthioribose-1-phosphate isomerase
LLQSDTSNVLASTDSLRAWLYPSLDYLYTSRPTAVNLGTAIARLRSTFAVFEKKGTNVHAVAQGLIADARAIAEEDVDRNRLMSKIGAEWLLDEMARKAKRLEQEGRVNMYAFPG